MGIDRKAQVDHIYREVQSGDYESLWEMASLAGCRGELGSSLYDIDYLISLRDLTGLDTFVHLGSNFFSRIRLDGSFDYFFGYTNDRNYPFLAKGGFPRIPGSYDLARRIFIDATNNPDLMAFLQVGERRSEIQNVLSILWANFRPILDTRIGRGILGPGISHQLQLTGTVYHRAAVKAVVEEAHSVP